MDLTPIILKKKKKIIQSQAVNCQSFKSFEYDKERRNIKISLDSEIEYLLLDQENDITDIKCINDANVFMYLYNQKNININCFKGSNTNIFMINEIDSLDQKININLEKDSNLEIYKFDFIKGNLHTNEFINIIGENSKVEIKRLNFSNENQNIEHKINVLHDSIRSTSHYTNFLFAKDSSRIKVDITAKIKEGMYLSNASQENRGVLLGKEAVIEVDPKLLIDCDDVLASHGAAIGTIDPEALYYLMSRGITKENSEKLIVGSYFETFYKALKNDEIKAYLFQLVNAIF